MSLHNLFVKSGYVKAPMANGVGRFVLQCQRMTIKFCKAHGGSNGVREFIECHLVDFARNNPGVVVYLKPRRHRSPVVVAEYLNGGREWLPLENMKKEEVAKWLEVLRTSAGYGEMHYRSYHHTDTPSIQGAWTPFVHKSPEQNLATFPQEDINPANMPPSATDIIKKMYGQSS